MKKYDPLWELVGEKRALLGVEEDVDARCPVCHVVLHIGAGAQAGEPRECGLCGAELRISLEGGAHLEIGSDELLTEDEQVPETATSPSGDMGEPAPDVP